ncbi:hypothetical protein SAMN05216275_14152 [Streptosporangium canum]|uniref:Uncharacterized protein n=1 Tax=Streptosporangium canum TaxID=324952 RepID=A0A1I4DHX4_9ACTN|nr:DUF6221 family protein [Streptosporangium canum]SFK92400.1 hypothetical protein SAMN05216275_14152 [Streptosporangium canum]
MSDLVAFLRARLDEDEQTARAAHGPNWNAEKRDVAYGDEWVVSAMTRADAAHIARHDPARVLREVEAKRQIINEHPALPGFKEGHAYTVCTRCSDYRGDDDRSIGDRLIRPAEAPCKTLRLLGLLYADHPDYRQEWNP